MNHPRPKHLPHGGLLLCLLLGAGATATAQTPAELLSQESGGQIAVAGESVFRMRGLVGTLALRTARPGELRYEARSLDNRREPRAVALLREGRALVLEPVAGGAEQRLLVEVVVPPELDVELELADSRVRVGGLGGALEVRGERLDVDVRGVARGLVLEIEQGKLYVEGAGRGVELDGRKLDGVIKNVGHSLSLRVTESRIEVDVVRGRSFLDVEDSELRASQLASELSLSARGGAVEIVGMARGGELILEEATLKLAESRGRIEVESDADVEFRAMDALLKIRNYGGAIRGSGNTSPTAVASDRSPVVLTGMQGPVTVSGDGLQVKIGESDGDIRIRTTGSQVEVFKAQGQVLVENDFGDVTVQEVAKTLRVTNLKGNVRLIAVSGAVEVQADADRVEVEWSQLARNDQVVENEGGELVAAFPPRARCRVEAESSYGRVESSLPAVRVSGDERFGSGALGGAKQPLITLKSGGDVIITGPGGR